VVRPCVYLILSFKCYGVHRNLHSFPTRRSSDLPRRLLVELRQLAADAGSPVAAARPRQVAQRRRDPAGSLVEHGRGRPRRDPREDRKSTRLNSSHVKISYAVFCLKKKIKTTSPL